jgi:hypothetical protein
VKLIRKVLDLRLCNVLITDDATAYAIITHDLTPRLLEPARRLGPDELA